MEGFSLRDSPAFEEWVLLEQERFQRKFVKTLRYLADSYEQRCEYELAIQAAHRWAALEPWQEEAHRKLMALLALSEQSAAALRQYELCRQSLAIELGVEPEPATTALYERIRDGALAAPSDEAPARPDSPFGVSAQHPLPVLEQKVERAQVPSPVSQPPERLEGERRVVTDLFARVERPPPSAGDVDLADPELWAETVYPVLEALAEEVSLRRGGQPVPRGRARRHLWFAPRKAARTRERA